MRELLAIAVKVVVRNEQRCFTAFRNTNLAKVKGIMLFKSITSDRYSYVNRDNDDTGSRCDQRFRV